MTARLMAAGPVVPSVDGMGAITVVPAVSASVEPGEHTTVDIVVRNTGTVVDSFAVQPLGPAAEWTVAEPDLVRLLPGEEAVVTLHFRPPRHFTTPAGPLHWAVRARSSEDPDGSVVDEGTLEVASFVDVQADLSPRTSRARGRRAGKHQLAIDNLSNRPVNVRLAAVDEAEKLGFSFPTPEVLLEPGAAQVVPLKVRATKRFWRGQPVTHPFTVLIDPEDGESLNADGALLQETVVPGLAAQGAHPRRDPVGCARRAVGHRAQADHRGHRPGAGRRDRGGRRRQGSGLSRWRRGRTAGGSRRGAQRQAGRGPDHRHRRPRRSRLEKSDGTPLSVRLAATESAQSPSTVLDKEFDVRVTDLLLQNPQGDSGIVTIKHGDQVVYVSRLDNFRDLDLHLVAPVTVEPKKTFTMQVACENAALAPAGTPGPAVHPGAHTERLRPG